ncbi:phage terminase small subunit P27 family [Clostridium tagluense]|uniref:phage terminase small subunit P27 family n=1 Tax=Clostridium tagluense TaxID=360422 RepID=UPI001C6EDC5D|nr:phage terminase small subunit P27 family [Clostridium tagluense]MBW9154870.1 phage terminase small subunit P27 family [Clostridium tagluense]WLC64325.1 phage terminase small subunit P27 family [Clostridium tagluense]
MPNIKPIALQNGHISNEAIEERQIAEDKLKGSTKVNMKAPKELSKNGKKLYKNIIELLPEGFLNGGDTFVVSIVAEALDRMSVSQVKINADGLFSEEGDENNAVKTYERYSKIFEKFSAKIGLSPKDRSALAILMLNDKDNNEDELLNILKS